MLLSSSSSLHSGHAHAPHAPQQLQQSSQQPCSCSSSAAAPAVFTAAMLMLISHANHMYQHHTCLAASKAISWVLLFLDVIFILSNFYFNQEFSNIVLCIVY
jgi:hypothetical protein